MNAVSSVGGLIPLWIIGAPLVLAIIGWMATPKAGRRV
jgi:hypothetical protein